MAPRRYTRELLAEAVAESVGWADLLRRLGMKESGGQRRVLQEKVGALGLDTSHFKQRSPWRKYTDEAIAEAVAESSTLREVVTRLGGKPATGTLSHIGRRITAAGIDTSHFPGLTQDRAELPFDATELATAAAASDSVRGVARALDVPDDSRSRAALGRMLAAHGIDTSHFRNSRARVPEEALRAAVPAALSFADVMRSMGMEVTDVNHQRVRRAIDRLGLDTAHFTRRPWAAVRPVIPRPLAPAVLVVLPPGAGRTNRTRLHRALREVGVAYRCVSCGNEGEWLGRPITLQIDHINGEWRDNRLQNLRYLCPNCHALTDTWCRGRRSKPRLVTDSELAIE
ncbi:HNH endonuclease signature motif containing protein [Streptomyces sp. NBC_01497]|uniref:HNH endonuclease signature motif containing protein n=1 Tax=Streptomyces sp. NBC_01497 TaxID=2903885 RepID=UPI002E346A21|nr:HNH endonuclease signature motif containing protein [Streptomyces sp. NBC_01497]